MFEQVAAEIERGFILNPGPDFVTMCMRLFGTMILCGIIGFEREIHKNTAGLRTNIMVGVASAAFALITLAMLDGSIGDDKAVKSDPLRLVEAVTGGVAFLAAGLVVFTKGEVRGLTTGASLWLSAAIGLAAGLGYWQIALLATLVGYLVLTALKSLKERLGVRDASD